MSDREPSRQWSCWSRAQAEQIERCEETVAPPAGMPDDDPAADRHVWDTWPLRTRQGEIAVVDGWQVLIALTAPADVTPAQRHDIAEHRYFISRDGADWIDAGSVFDDGALGTRQWAGSAIVADGELYCFYTAAGDTDSAERTYTQRLAVGYGGRIETTDNRVTISGPWSHEILLEPDGEWYETQAQSGEMTYTFRDPWFFVDPETEQMCLLFESNTPALAADCGGNTDQQSFNGCVGLAVSPSDDPREWEFRQPIFDSVCVNQEIERPHIVHREDRYYLFVSSHVDTFAPGLAGYDGLYGFVADSLDGDYRPLNESGLVVTNPATAPFQAYSWLAIGHGEELLVSGFLNYPAFSGSALGELAALSGEEQRQRFAGTLTPTLRLAVDGDSTRIRGTLGHWRFPRANETLPPVDELCISPADIVSDPGLTRTASRRDEGPVW